LRNKVSAKKSLGDYWKKELDEKGRASSAFGKNHKFCTYYGRGIQKVKGKNKALLGGWGGGGGLSRNY